MKTIQNFPQTLSLNFFRFAAFCLMLACAPTVSNADCVPTENQMIQLEKETLTASFSVSNNGHRLGEATIFVNQSIDANAYLWDFGDGNSSSAANPAHTYQSAGTFTVKLTVIGDGGTAEFIGTVDVIDN